MSTDPYLLEVTDLTVAYGAVIACSNVNIYVHRGEIVSLIGPNGAGKTTLLSSLVGLVRPRAGDIRFDGGSLAGRKPEDLVAEGIAMVPEGRQIFTRLTVQENLRLGATTRKDGDIEADIERELNRFPALRRLYGANAGKLSGGEQQMLAIARALLSRPTLILLDEPSLGLAPKVTSDVVAALGALRDDGVTVLLVEQHAARAIALADRTYVMSAGTIVLEGDSTTLNSMEAIEAAYLGQAEPQEVAP
jgi:branched-chain amino acid transport system ATP-binding protein